MRQLNLYTGSYSLILMALFKVWNIWLKERKDFDKRKKCYDCKELRALRGSPPHPLRLNYKKCFFFTNLFFLVYQNNNQSVKVANYFDFYHCYGNKNGPKVG